MPTVRVDGADLWYREAGEGHPVLLIHGISIDADHWTPIFKDLAQDHRVIAYDRRGTTRSRDAGALADWHRHGEDAAGILRTLNAAPAVVAGWSGGATVAVDLAVEHPDLVRALILIEPGLFPRKNITAGLIRDQLRLRLLTRIGRHRQAFEGSARWYTSRRSGGSSWDDPDYPQDRKEAMFANRATSALESTARDEYLLDRVGEIDMPVRILVGDESPTWFERMARYLATRMPRAEFEVVPGMNHAVALTGRDAVVRAVRSAVSAAVA